MVLWKKTLLASVLTLLGIIASMLVATQFILMRSFSRLESTYVQENLQRLRGEFGEDLDALASTDKDYAAWDTSYRFMRDRNPEYLHEFAEDSLQNLRVRGVAIFDVHGSAVLLKSVPEERPLFSAVDLDIVRRAVSQRRPVRGIVMLSDGPLELAAYPITDTNQHLRARGMLAMLRSIDEKLVSRLSFSVGLPVTIRDLRHLPPGSDANPAVRVLDENNIAASGYLQDVFYRQALLIGISMPRAVHHQAEQTLRFYVVTIVAAGVLLSLLKFLFIRKHVVARIEALSDTVSTITSVDNSAVRLQVRGEDEFARLASAVNNMLDGLELSHRELLDVHDQLRFRATHDYLTGTWNRAAILDFLCRELARSARGMGSVSVLMLDIDYFKQVNDTYGHATGDEVLRQVSREIICHVRPFDAVGRYGGDEFLVILPGCSVADAWRVAERIRLGLRELTITVENKPVMITISAGAVEGSSPASPDELVERADAALYRAKNGGRDCVQTTLELVGKRQPASAEDEDTIGHEMPSEEDRKAIGH